jgi:hypothetical protein
MFHCVAIQACVRRLFLSASFLLLIAIKQGSIQPVNAHSRRPADEAARATGVGGMALAAIRRARPAETAAPIIQQHCEFSVDFVFMFDPLYCPFSLRDISKESAAVSIPLAPLELGIARPFRQVRIQEPAAESAARSGWNSGRKPTRPH